MLQKGIKVLYPILHYPPVIGGLEQWSQNIAERQDRDIEIVVVTGRVTGEKNFEKKGNVCITRTSLFTLTDLSHSSAFYILTALPFIFFRALGKARDADMFHCHGFLSAGMGYALSRFTGKPFVVTEQSTGLGSGVSKWLRGIIYRKAMICIGASKATVEEFLELGVKNTEVIPNGVDVEKFGQCKNCRKNGNEDRVCTILSVGRLEKVKGHRYLIEAFSKIKKEIPQSRLVLIGDGSERENLKKEVGVLGLQNSVKFLGEIPHDELPHHYHKADIFCMPSLAEGFGITVLEAMAAGLPVVTTRVGGLLDIVENQKTGLLIEPANSEAIAQAIVRLYGDEALKSFLVENAKRRVLEFDWSKSAEKVGEVYRIIARK